MDKKLNNIPHENSDWMEIQEFNLTFNAYDYWGSLEKTAEIANEHFKIYEKNNVISNNIKVLKTVIFFEQRRYRHSGDEPLPEMMGYLRKIINKIKKLVK